eukprot:scaffold10013_cov79-Skeletonema_dohrnii-CCMP3373.AAC.30
MSTSWQSSASRRRPSTSSFGASFSGRRIAGSSSRSTATGTRFPTSSNTILSNRPMTGTGGMARKIKPSTPQTNIVYNAAFYSNLLQSKTSQILEEMERLRSEIGEEDIRRALEKQLADTTKDVKDLERQLADYNMAKDKARSGASHEDIRRQTHLLQARNKRLENEVDEIFLSRKKTEDEISRLQLEMSNMKQEFAVQKLIGEIENIHEEGRAEEEKMAQLSNRMKEIESTMVGKDPMFGNKEEETRVVDLKRSIARIEEEIQLLGMDDDAAREYLLDKAQQEQELNDNLSSIQDEIKDLATEQRELRSRLRVLNGGAAAQLLERMEEIDLFLSNSADAKANLENDRISITTAIEALQDEISAAKKLTECPMPTVNEVELMKEEVAFTNSQLEINQDTVNRLQQQKLARMEELDRVSHLEERMEAEMKELARRTNQMTSEMEKFDMDALKVDSAARREDLAERCECFEQRLNHINATMSKLRVAYDEQMKRCGGENWVSFEENNMNLQQSMRAVCELQNKVNKDNMHSYSGTKSECLELVQKLNSMILKCNEEM